MGYITHEIEITKEAYDYYRTLPYKKLKEVVAEIASKMGYSPNAYGLYSIKVLSFWKVEVMNYKYFLQFETQDSCD